MKAGELIAVDDVAYFEGPLLLSVSASHLVTIATGIAMNGIVIAGLYLPLWARRKTGPAWVGPALAGAYAVNTALLLVI